jgi:hypothetical protein
MEPRDNRPDDGCGDVPGLHDLVEAGVLIPATRRVTEVIAARPPLKIENAQATKSAIDEHAPAARALPREMVDDTCELLKVTRCPHPPVKGVLEDGDGPVAKPCEVAKYLGRFAKDWHDGESMAPRATPG